MAEDGNISRKRPRIATPAASNDNNGSNDNNYAFINDFNFDAFVDDSGTLGLTEQDLLQPGTSDLLLSFSNVDVINSITMNDGSLQSNANNGIALSDTNSRRPSNQSVNGQLNEASNMTTNQCPAVANDQPNETSTMATKQCPAAAGQPAGQNDATETSTTAAAAVSSQPIAIPKQTVFTVIVADKAFRMSWETLCSDGPSNFFIEYFTRNPKSRTVRIDRDPETFKIILHYLRGYQIRPNDEYENQNLMNDARYYGLKRLTQFLRQTLFLNVGGRVFRLSKDLFTRDGPGNFFTGPLIHYLFYTHIKQSEAPPYIIDRNPDTFAEIVSHLQGYSIQIRDEVHRANLLKDAQYYSFRRLRDKLLTARKTIDGFGESGTQEVLLWLKDVRLTNLMPSQAQEQKVSESPEFTDAEDMRAFYQIRYKREENPHNLLIQLSEFYLYYPHTGAERRCRMELCPTERQKLENMAKVVKLDGISDLACMNLDSAIKIDDQAVTAKELLDSEKSHKLCVLKAIAAVLSFNNQLTLCMLRFEAVSSRLQLNLKREFLP